MRTYDYILAMREENENIELDPFSDSDSDDSDYDSPEKPSFVSRFICRGQNPNQVISSIMLKLIV